MNFSDAFYFKADSTPSATTYDGEVVVEPVGADKIGYSVRDGLQGVMDKATFSYERGKFRCSVRGDIYEKLVQQREDGSLYCNLGFRKNKEWLHKVTRMRVEL